jgi:glycosyltransferase involved in cell wall biosynthesis
VTPRGLVFVSRRFWPLCGGPQTALGSLGAELAARGHRVTLLTARWQDDWPAEIDYHGVRVVRLPRPAVRLGRVWGGVRYLRAISRWLADHRGRIDLVYVSMLKHEACAAVAAGERLGFPVVLRAEGAGYPRDRIRYVPNGVRPAAKASDVTRTAIRRSLTESDPRWAVPTDSRVAVFCGQLVESKGLRRLLEAWPAVVAAHGKARLWLVGDGPQRAELEKQIVEMKLNETAVLTGAFDLVRDFLLAADAFVLSSLEEGTSLALLEAMSHAMPVVATNVPGNQALIDHEVHGLLVPPEDPASLAAAIQRLWSEPDLAERLGAAAAVRVKEEFSLAEMVKRHVEVFEALLEHPA